MDIFENLENLNVSEECFNNIIALIEEEVKKYKSGLSDATIDSMLAKRKEAMDKAKNAYDPNEPNRAERRRKWVDKTIKRSEAKRAHQAAFVKKLQANPEGESDGLFTKGRKNKELIAGAKDTLKRLQRTVPYQRECAKDDKKMDFRYKTKKRR